MTEQASHAGGTKRPARQSDERAPGAPDEPRIVVLVGRTLVQRCGHEVLGPAEAGLPNC